MAKMSEEEIAALVSAEIEDAVSYDRTELDSDRAKAIEYYRGEMNDLTAEDGRSSVVDHTVQDVIGWILPGLMRVFFGSDQVVVYEPKSEEDTAGSKQATEYVNHVVLKDCEGYQVFWDVFHDALLHRNGVLKHFWDPTPDTKIEVLCVTEDQMTQLTAADEVEVLEHTERDPMMMETEQGPVEIIYHDLKIKVETSKGCLKIMAVPPEEFLIDRAAVDIEDARFVGHRTMKTRSDLLKMGFDRDEVDALPGFGSLDFNEVATARRDDAGMVGYPGKNKASEEIELFECYMLADHDEDGIAEMLRVYAAGPSGAKVLDWEIWEDDAPFSDLTPERVPHRWQGRSVYDDTQDIQRIKSVLMRSMLDNLYQSNIPDRVANEQAILNPDALFDRKIGNVIRVKGDPNAAIANLSVEFTAQHSFAALEYMDGMVEKRTGVSKASMGLDPETLQNQSATAANIQQSASYSKIELIARNFAEMGMKRAFRAILKIIVKHQDRPRTIRLRNEWVEMDPRGWNADMDATVNVGLGSGSRDRDMMFLNVILQQQKEALALAGGAATQYGQKLAKAVHHTMQKMVEASGLKSPETYFPELSDEEMQELKQAAQQASPEAQKIKAQMELETKKAEMQVELKTKEMQQKAEIEKLQAEADVAVKERETEAQAALKQREFEHKAELDRRKFEFDKQLKLIELWVNAQKDMSAEAAKQEGGSKKNGLSKDKLAAVIEQVGGNLSPGMIATGKTPPTPLEEAVSRLTDLQGQMQQIMAAPKRVVRDNAGRVVGVETVQ